MCQTAVVKWMSVQLWGAGISMSEPIRREEWEPWSVWTAGSVCVSPQWAHYIMSRTSRIDAIEAANTGGADGSCCREWLDRAATFKSDQVLGVSAGDSSWHSCLWRHLTRSCLPVYQTDVVSKIKLWLWEVVGSPGSHILLPLCRRDRLPLGPSEPLRPQRPELRTRNFSKMVTWRKKKLRILCTNC